MHRNIFIAFLALVLLLEISECIVCTPYICAAVQCQAVEGCTGANQVIKPGGFCNCCNKCHTILRENETCSSISSMLRGSPAPLSQCGQGLVCHEGKCQSFKALGKNVA